MRTLKPLIHQHTWAGVGRTLVDGKGFPTIDVPGLNSKLVELKDKMHAFCQQPLAVRERWSIDLHLKEVGTYDNDRGYIFRDGGIHDTKDMMHFRPSLYGELKHKEVILTAPETAFLDAMQKMYTEFAHVYERTVAGMEGVLPPSVIKQMRNGSCEHLLRLIRYHPEFEYYAQPHCDQSCLTFPLGDMDEHGNQYPGLVIPEHSLDPISLPIDQLIVMNGTKAGITTSPEIECVGHRALIWEDWLAQDSVLLPTLHSAKSGKNERYRFAFIFFAHCDIGLSGDQVSKVQKRLTKHLAKTQYDFLLPK